MALFEIGERLLSLGLLSPQANALFQRQVRRALAELLLSETREALQFLKRAGHRRSPKTYSAEAAACSPINEHGPTNPHLKLYEIEPLRYNGRLDDTAFGNGARTGFFQLPNVQIKMILCLLIFEVITMNEQRLLERIACDSQVMAGKPVIKGTRLTVEFILNLLAHGSTVEEILDEYDGLTREDIQACLLFASQFLGNTTFMPLAGSA